MSYKLARQRILEPVLHVEAAAPMHEVVRWDSAKGKLMWEQGERMVKDEV